MVLVVRNDLKMGKGKIGAQCGHATLGTYKLTQQWSEYSSYWKSVLRRWNSEGQKKICVKVESLPEVLALLGKAKEQGIPYYLVADAGHTQVEAGSKTVLGLGPATARQLDVVTGEMKLL